jgi:hypothetical protein
MADLAEGRLRLDRLNAMALVRLSSPGSLRDAIPRGTQETLPADILR